MIQIWKISPHPTELLQIEQIQLDQNAQSLNGAASYLPQGVYTTLRTYKGNQTLPLEDHIHRLEESAALTGVTIHLRSEDLRKGIRRAIQDFWPQDTRIRVTVDTTQEHGSIYIAVEPLHVPPPGAYEDGVWVVTQPYQRKNPRAKTTSFIARAESLRKALPEGANEVLMLAEDGRILEGTSSNFFAVRGGEIWTAGEGVLGGITRSLVLKVALEEGLKVRYESVNVEDKALLEEAFLTSASRSVLPIRQIDEAMIGAGKPGPVTWIIMQAYWREVEQRLSEI
jgi:branched-chain amino acid aminotransferase